MNRKSYILLAALITVAAAVPSQAALFKKDKAEAATVEAKKEVVAKPRVEVVVVKLRDKVETGISTTSTIEAIQEVHIIPKVVGRVDRILVKKGDIVNQGDVLVKLDAKSEQAQYNSLKAQVAVDKASHAQSKVSLADAKREYERYSRLLKTGYATQQEYDTRNTTYQAAQAATEQAAAQIEMAKANLDAQGVTVKEFDLVAPIDGIVLDDFDLVRGTLVNTSTNVLRVGNVDRLKAPVYIPERDASRLRLGMEGEFIFEARPDERFYGIIGQIDPFVDTATRTIRADVIIDNQATGYKLYPGMFARVLLVEARANNPLVIPTDALRKDGTVMVIREGKAVIQPVKTGVTISGKLVSISEGLSLGEDVVVYGGNNVAEGAEVEVVVVDEADIRSTSK